jgi:hypothetical protein
VLIRKKVSARALCFEYGCDLPAAQMYITRAVSMQAGSQVVNIRETITNLARRDVPFTICQHVTFGPPFLEQNVTAFDMSATEGHTFPAKFGSPQRLKIDCGFQWPAGPGLKGKIDLRFAGRGKHGDFHANLMNPKKEQVSFDGRKDWRLVWTQDEAKVPG